MKQINEAVDYESLFNPINKIVAKYKDEDTANLLKKQQAENIKKVKQMVGNYNWNNYILKVYRSNLAKAAMGMTTDRHERNALQKMVMPFETDVRTVGKLIQQFSHFKGINYAPIQKFIPNGDPDTVIKTLNGYEEEYKENLGDDNRMISPDEESEIIINLPNNFAWVKLDSYYCDLEADAMGHCGNSGGNSNQRIISLRKIHNMNGETYHEPYATFIFDTSDGTFGEMKGRANEKPATRYHPAIIELLKQPWVKGFGNGGYKPENNFSIDDLTEQQREYLLNANPNLRLYPGVLLSSVPEELITQKYATAPGKYDTMWYDTNAKKILVKIDADDLVSKNLLDYINDDMHTVTDHISDSEALEGLNDLPREYIADMYSKLFSDSGVDQAEFVDHVYRYGLDEEFIEENNLYDIIEGNDELTRIYRDAYQWEYEREVINYIKNELDSSSVRIGYDDYTGSEGYELDFYGAFDGDQALEGRFFPDSDIVMSSDVYIPDDTKDNGGIQFLSSNGYEKDPISIDQDIYPYIKKEDLIQSYIDMFGTITKEENVGESKLTENMENVKSNLKARKVDGGFMIVSGNEAWNSKTNTWHDINSINGQSDFVGYDKAQLIKNYALKNRNNEAEEQPVTEHADPSPYVTPWIEKGYDIQIEDFSSGDSEEIGKKFTINKDDISAVIYEPKEGEYHYENEIYPNFDMAMDKVLNSSNADEYVTENLRRLAGITECSGDEECTCGEELEESSEPSMRDILNRLG